MEKRLSGRRGNAPKHKPIEFPTGEVPSKRKYDDGESDEDIVCIDSSDGESRTPRGPLPKVKKRFNRNYNEDFNDRQSNSMNMNQNNQQFQNSNMDNFGMMMPSNQYDDQISASDQMNCGNNYSDMGNMVTMNNLVNMGGIAGMNTMCNTNIMDNGSTMNTMANFGGLKNNGQMNANIMNSNMGAMNNMGNLSNMNNMSLMNQMNMMNSMRNMGTTNNFTNVGGMSTKSALSRISPRSPETSVNSNSNSDRKYPNFNRRRLGNSDNNRHSTIIDDCISSDDDRSNGYDSTEEQDSRPKGNILLDELDKMNPCEDEKKTISKDEEEALLKIVQKPEVFEPVLSKSYLKRKRKRAAKANTDESDAPIEQVGLSIY